ncbi:MAG: hypothetical protein ACREBW_01780 [Candidatus Micrarchaeaceae archaeon]
MTTPILSVGTKAYLDSFVGLVPCKVLAISEEHRVTVKLTAQRGAYKRGEVLPDQSARHIVPRSAVFIRCGQYRIRSFQVQRGQS